MTFWKIEGELRLAKIVSWGVQSFLVFGEACMQSLHHAGLVFWGAYQAKKHQDLFKQPCHWNKNGMQVLCPGSSLRLGGIQRILS